jgi:hypothetical protein
MKLKGRQVPQNHEISKDLFILVWTTKVMICRFARKKIGHRIGSQSRDVCNRANCSKHEMMTRRGASDLLITLSCTSSPPRGGNLRLSEPLSCMYGSGISVVTSDEGGLVGNGTAGDWTILPPEPDTDLSRIEMRLLRDTSSVLEYLEKTDVVHQLRRWCDRDGVFTSFRVRMCCGKRCRSKSDSDKGR